MRTERTKPAGLAAAPFVAPRPLNCACGAPAWLGFDVFPKQGKAGVWMCRRCAEDAGLIPAIPDQGSER